MKPKVYKAGQQWVVMWIDRDGSAGAGLTPCWNSAMRRAARAAREGSW